LQAGAAAEGVVREGENVIGLMVGKMEEEQVQALVNGVDEAHLPCQGMDRADASAAEAADAVGDLIVAFRGSEHGLAAAVSVGTIEPALDTLLAAAQLAAYLGIHSKFLRERMVSWGHQP